MSIDLQALEEPVTRILTAPGVDLSTISAKRVRKALLTDAHYAFLGLTTEALKEHREAVDGVIARIFEAVSRNATAVSEGSEGASKRKREDDETYEGGEGAEEGEPSERSENAEEGESAKIQAPKKKKGKKTVEESDAELARKLSSEINGRSRRGSANVAAASPRKAKRKPKKSAETVDSEEDEDGETKPKKRSTGAKGGFAKEYLLSEPLSAVLGVEKLSRPQVVKKLWEYIRAHELQNPSNKREIICDSGLRSVFAVDKIDMFRMNKVLGQHLHEE